jgi:hypothetical protein
MTVRRAAPSRSPPEVPLDALIEFLVLVISTTVTTIFNFISLYGKRKSSWIWCENQVLSFSNAIHAEFSNRLYATWDVFVRSSVHEE